MNKKIHISFIAVILFFSVLNDVLRVPGTPVSLFRLLLPLILLYCLPYIKKKKNLIVIAILLIALYVVQSYVFSKLLLKKDYLNITHIGTYIVYFVSVFTIFLSIRVLREKKGDAFEKYFFDFILKVGYVYTILFFISMSPLCEVLGTANRNTYAAGVAAIFPIYLISAYSGRMLDNIVCILVIAGMYIGDCKAAMMGVFLQIGVFVVTLFMRRIKDSKKYFVLLFGMLVVCILLLLNSSFSINSYNIGEMFYNMRDHILNLELFPNNNSSLAYRTNSIVLLIKALLESRFLGLGLGNTSIYLAEIMKNDLPASLSASTSISPHFGLLEFYVDCGIWGIVVTVIPLVIAIRKLINGKNNDLLDCAFIMFTISFPMWCMSASGIYTVYIIYIMMAFFLEIGCLKKEKLYVYVLQDMEKETNDKFKNKKTNKSIVI